MIHAIVDAMPSHSALRAAAATLLVVTLLAACGSLGTPTPPSASSTGPVSYQGWPPTASFELVPIPVSSELTVGPNRLLVNLIDSDNEPLASADRQVRLQLYDLAADAQTPKTQVDATYTPIIEGRPGLYRAQVTFERAGDWGLEAIATEPGGEERTGRMVFSVRESGTTPAIGAQAPASDTPVAITSAEVADISTDDDPDPDFYRDSVADALEAGQPFVLVFATPAFCRTATCAPALDIVKSVAAFHKDQVTFIHVEPYQLERVDGALQPVLSDQNLPIAVEATNEWGLPTEPYIFVVDSNGKVAAKFEGVAAVEELEAAIAELGQ
jgi:hypothetical protein